MKMYQLYLAGGVVAAPLLFHFAANAQAPQCGPLEMVESHLRENFAEKPLIEWDANAGEGREPNTARIYANTQTGSLTLLIITQSHGRTLGCLMATGQNMRIAPQFKQAEHPL